MRSLWLFLASFTLGFVLSVVLSTSLSGCGRRIGPMGIPGAPGAPGADGSNGHNALADVLEQVNGGGSSCVNGGFTLLTGTDLNDNMLLDISEIVYTKDVCNGLNGSNAPATPYTPVGLVDPCGDKANVFDEVFIRMANGQLLASFSDNANGLNTRFSLITPGSYRTTDGSNCYFSVDNNFQLYNEHY